jgi:hypothetical protein
MVAHRFKKGSRVRVAISEGLWPLLWPSPQVATLTFDLSACSLILPVRPAPPVEAPFPIPVNHSAGSSPYTHSDMGPGTRGHLDDPLSTTLIAEIGTTVQTKRSARSSANCSERRRKRRSPHTAASRHLGVVRLGVSQGGGAWEGVGYCSATIRMRVRMDRKSLTGRQRFGEPKRLKNQGNSMVRGTGIEPVAPAV